MIADPHYVVTDSADCYTKFLCYLSVIPTILTQLFYFQDLLRSEFELMCSYMTTLCHHVIYIVLPCS